MIHTRNFVNAYSGLVSKSVRTFAAASQRAKDTPKDLDKYDVVIIGSNLGGILSRQFEQFTRNYYKVMVIYDRNANEMLPIRGIYEQGQASKNEYQLTAKLAIDNHTAHSDGVGVEKIIPNENAVVLRNSRRIEYDHLVIAMGINQYFHKYLKYIIRIGLNEDYEAIKGFEEAWQDIQHPVFTHKDYTFWKSSDPKHQRWISNFTGGNAFFCLPPLPYRGEGNLINKRISRL